LFEAEVNQGHAVTVLLWACPELRVVLMTNSVEKLFRHGKGNVCGLVRYTHTQTYTH